MTFNDIGSEHVYKTTSVGFYSFFKIKRIAYMKSKHPQNKNNIK